VLLVSSSDDFGLVKVGEVEELDGLSVLGFEFVEIIPALALILFNSSWANLLNSSDCVFIFLKRDGTPS
jgi:hypothetical protein